MAFPRDDVYHADSDADDEFERSIMTSPTQVATDSESESEPPSNNHTPTMFGPGENGERTFIRQWSPDDCAQFVANLNLQQYSEAFVEHGIDGDALIALKQEELKEMGIASVGHRLLILKHVYDIKINQDVPMQPDDYIPQSAEQNFQHENVTKEELAHVARSIIKSRDERIAQAEAQLLRLAEDYRKLRMELLPLFKMTKERSDPLPYAPYQPTTASDMYSDGLTSPPATSQSVPEKSSLSRSLSKKLGIGSAPKTNSPTHIPTTIHENRALTDPSNLNPSAAASAASTQLSNVMHQQSPGSVPSPTSPMPFHPLAPRAYQREAPTSASRYDGSEEPPPRSNPTPTPPIIHDPPKSANANKFSTSSSFSQASTLAPSRELSASVPPQFGRSSDRQSHATTSTSTNDRDRHTPAPPTDGDAPSVEIFKSFRVALEDPCYRVLPAALRKYNIQADWRQYALYIVYGDQERCVGLEEKPLQLFKDLFREGKKPMFMLRKLANPVEGGPPNMGGMGGGSIGGSSGGGGSLSGGTGGIGGGMGSSGVMSQAHTAGVGMSRPLGQGGGVGPNTAGPGIPSGGGGGSIRSMQMGSGAILPGGVL